MIGSCSVWGKAPTRQFHSNPITVSESGHTGKNQFIRCCHPYARTSAAQAVLIRMKVILHATRRTPHGASRLVLAMSARSVKTLRAPSQHCRDASVYGHTTTAMYDDKYTPPLPRSSNAVAMPDRRKPRQPQRDERFVVLI